MFDANRPYLQFCAVSRRIAVRARDLGSQFNRLTVPDAIHIATALEAAVDAFLTYDGAPELKSELKKNRRSGGLLAFNGQIGNPPLRIETPRVDWGPVFAGLSQPS